MCAVQCTDMKQVGNTLGELVKTRKRPGAVRAGVERRFRVVIAVRRLVVVIVGRRRRHVAEGRECLMVWHGRGGRCGGRRRGCDCRRVGDCCRTGGGANRGLTTTRMHGPRRKGSRME